MKEFIKDIILPFLPSLLTILGWWIVGKRDNKSKKHGIHNKRVEVAIEVSEKILVNVKDFYNIDGRNIDAERSRSVIKSDFKKLSSIITLLAEDMEYTSKTGLFTDFLSYKKVATGGEFESKSRSIYDLSSQFFADLDGTHNDFYIHLQRIYLV